MDNLKIVGLILFASMVVGCGAEFEDLRPTGSAVPDPVSDGPISDNPEPPPSNDNPDNLTPGVLAMGTVSGTGGYTGTGTVFLNRREDGALEIEFSSDFSFSGVPGPVLVLNRRDRVGRRLEAGDLRIGPFSSTSGAQTYLVPEEAANTTWVWIWCEPFGVDIAFAVLEPSP